MRRLHKLQLRLQTRLLFVVLLPSVLLLVMLLFVVLLPPQLLPVVLIPLLLQPLLPILLQPLLLRVRARGRDRARRAHIHHLRDQGDLAQARREDRGQEGG